jgi:hypothetical protein
MGPREILVPFYFSQKQKNIQQKNTTLCLMVSAYDCCIFEETQENAASCSFAFFFKLPLC